MGPRKSQRRGQGGSLQHRVFRNWFENLDFQECEDGSLVLRAPNKFVASYIETHLGKPLLGTTQQVYEGITSVRIETAG